MSNEFFTPQSRNEAILQNICGANNVLPEPQSRIEKLLQAILYEDATIVDFTPESRAELLLYAILTHGEYDAEPQSRNETILKAILTNGDYDALPQSRIEALLIEWLDQTHYEEKTVSGDVVSFADAVDAPVVDLTAAIVPVQSGSGDPSPTNIRPISGWTECKVYRSGADTSDPTVYPVSWQTEAGTVYGGTLDVTTGTLTVTHRYYELQPTTVGAMHYIAGYARAYMGNQLSQYPATNGTLVDFYCDTLQPANIYNAAKNGIYIFSKSYLSISISYDAIDGYSDVGDTSNYRAAVSKYLRDNKVNICYPLDTPIVYNLSPVEIRTLAGQNTIWADTGSVTVTYKARRTAAALMMMAGIF